MQTMFDWNEARYFLAVHRAGSLSAAGRLLRIDQSTVGRRLASLEQALGVRLFDRTPNGYVLTTAGERILPRLEAIEMEMHGIDRDLAGRESRLSGSVRLTAPDAFSSRVLTPLLADFCRRHPEITIELVADNRTLSLSKREADLALRLARPKQPLLFTRQVTEVGSALYAARSYLARHGEQRHPGFAGDHFIGFDESFQPDLEVSWLSRHAREARVVYRANSTHAQLAAAAAGLGIALLPCYLADGLVELTQILPPAQVVMRSLWMVVHRDLRRAARIRAISEFLMEALAGQAARLRGQLDRS
jgi:DNA-binding transcriptional LysR family regulator